jgi:hypothetical protein
VPDDEFPEFGELEDLDVGEEPPAGPRSPGYQALPLEPELAPPEPVEDVEVGDAPTEVAAPRQYNQLRNDGPREDGELEDKHVGDAPTEF